MTTPTVDPQEILPELGVPAVQKDVEGAMLISTDNVSGNAGSGHVQRRVLPTRLIIQTSGVFDVGAAALAQPRHCTGEDECERSVRKARVVHARSEQ
jgi:hypothetical protein